MWEGTIDREAIRAHWQDWANQYGDDLRATTKTRSIKAIETDALIRAVRAAHPYSSSLRMLEVGCGNGLNCLALAEAFPQAQIDGVDFVQEMVASAQRLSAGSGLADRLRFAQGDALELASHPGLHEQYDVIFTVRCLINLPEHGMQLAAVSSMANKLAPGGSLVLLENNETTYGNQNRLREFAGLDPRVPDPYNRFMDQDALLARARELRLVEAAIVDFASLHDIVLYVLLPAVNGGKVDYDHPLVEAAKQVQLGTAGHLGDNSGAPDPSVPRGPFGPFGQNRLYHWRKPE